MAGQVIADVALTAGKQHKDKAGDVQRVETLTLPAGEPFSPAEYGLKDDEVARMRNRGLLRGENDKPDAAKPAPKETETPVEEPGGKRDKPRKG